MNRKNSKKKMEKMEIPKQKISKKKNKILFDILFRVKAPFRIKPNALSFRKYKLTQKNKRDKRGFK